MTDHTAETSVLTVSKVVSHLRSTRRRLGLLVAGAASLTIVHWAIAPREYTARATFAPELGAPSLSGLGSLGGWAARFGLGNAPGTVPLPFYAELLTGETFLDRMVGTTVLTAQAHDSTTLLELYTDPSAPEPERRVEAREEALDRTFTTINEDASTVTIEYRARDPVLAASVVNAYVSLVNDFNVSERRSQAKALRAFLEETAIPQAAADLKAAEDSLATFYARNRSFESSPLLRLQEARLQRRIAIKQQGYLELASQVEQARVDEIRNTPVITVLASGSAPVDPSSPRLLVNLPLGVLLAFSLWIIWAAGEDYLRLVWREAR